MINKKFTILTSAYNSSLYLNEWAKSIIKQDYRPLEVVLVNDRSKDNTKKFQKLTEYFGRNKYKSVFCQNFTH